MMNKIKFLANISIAPVYFTLLVLVGFYGVIKDSAREIVDSYRETKRIYGIK